MGPRFWGYLAGIDSVDDLRASTRPRVTAWTAAPRSRKGDVVVIYGKSPVQGYVAVARQCSDPVESRHGRVWTWLQIQPMRQVLPQSKLAARSRIRGHAGLKTPAGGSSNLIPSGPGLHAFLRLLSSGDSAVGRRLEQWGEGGGRYPTGLSGVFLRPAWLEEPQKNGLPDGHERDLSRGIANWLVDRGEGRWCDENEDVGGHSTERPMAIRGARRYADVVLLDNKRRRTLILVEVKKHARPVPRMDPVPQVLNYRAQLLVDHPGWRVRCMIVAPEFHELTLRSARDNRIECRRCDARGKRLRPA